ncbi:MAG: hypothetical protein AAF617_03165 [Bacteroidota bacterium]
MFLSNTNAALIWTDYRAIARNDESNFYQKSLAFIIEIDVTIRIHLPLTLLNLRFPACHIKRS